MPAQSERESPSSFRDFAEHVNEVLVCLACVLIETRDNIAEVFAVEGRMFDENSGLNVDQDEHHPLETASQAEVS
jgi:hypothetical protein